LGVFSAIRAENNPATAQQRSFDIATTRTAGAFLAKKFSSAASHVTAVFDSRRSGTPVGQLHSDNLMQHTGFDRHTEHIVRKFDLRNLLAFYILDIYDRHSFPHLLSWIHISGSFNLV
jgi:hypothetical protein